MTVAQAESTSHSMERKPCDALWLYPAIGAPRVSCCTQSNGQSTVCRVLIMASVILPFSQCDKCEVQGYKAGHL